MNGSLNNHRSLIIGGGSGIGFATAAEMLKGGADVTIAGRTRTTLESAQKRLQALAKDHGGNIRFITCDVMNSVDVQAAVEFAEQGQGLDSAITVPGGGDYRPVLGYDDDEFSHQVDMNIRPQYLVLKYAGLSMIRAGKPGSIVMISSTAARFSCRYLAAYCAGKAAVNHLVHVAADELGDKNIRVNAVSPGLTRSGTTEAMIATPGLVEDFLAQQPLARIGEAEDQANMIRFLAGRESSWITGQVIEVDGGHTLRSFPHSPEILRAVAGDDLVDRVNRGEAP